MKETMITTLAQKQKMEIIKLLLAGFHHRDGFPGRFLRTLQSHPASALPRTTGL
jgi:hypothetical protein